MTGWRLGWVGRAGAVTSAISRSSRRTSTSRRPRRRSARRSPASAPRRSTILEVAAARVRSAARLSRAGAARARFSRSGACRPAASSSTPTARRWPRDSQAFCRDVLEAAGVAFTPGVDFGAHRAAEHVRFAYTIAEPRSTTALARLARYLAPRRRDIRAGTPMTTSSPLRRPCCARRRCARRSDAAADYYWQGASGQLRHSWRGRKPIDEVIARITRRRADSSACGACRRSARSRAASSRCPTTRATRATPTSAGRSSCGTCSPRRSFRSHRGSGAFPSPGCVNYRGYFSENEARDEAARLHAARATTYAVERRAGVFDAGLVRRSGAVHVRPLAGTRGRAAGLPRARAPGGLRQGRHRSSTNRSRPRSRRRACARWLAGAGRRRSSPRSTCARRAPARRVPRPGPRDPRRSSRAIYASDATDADKRAAQGGVLAAMREAYERAKAGEPGLAGYDRWFAGYERRGPNNASLAVRRAVYAARSPRSARCWPRQGGDLPRFYERVEGAGGARPRLERDAVLAAGGQAVPRRSRSRRDAAAWHCTGAIGDRPPHRAPLHSGSDCRRRID